MDVKSRFTVHAVVAKYRPSAEIRADRSPALVKVGVESARITCEICGEAWVARMTGRGRFVPTIGAIVITCPECGATEAVRAGELPG